MRTKMVKGPGELRLTSRGKPYWTGKFYQADGAGPVNACVWNLSQQVEDADVGDIIDANYLEKEFNGAPQFDISMIYGIYTPNDEERRQYVQTSPITQDIFLAFWSAEVLPLLKDQGLKSLVNVVLMDRRFWQAPAGKEFHHARIGGLAEHVWGMLTLLVAIAKAGHPVVERIDMSLVVAGVICHDYMKVLEYEEVSLGIFDIAPYGDLIGHVAGGPIAIEQIIAQRKIELSADTKTKLYHILLSHHMQASWGSPIGVHTPEAQLVHSLDNMDAHLTMFAETENGARHKVIGRVFWNEETKEQQS